MEPVVSVIKVILTVERGMSMGFMGWEWGRRGEKG